MSDIVANPEQYFRKFVPLRDELLTALENEARQREIPIVGPVVGELLGLLVSVMRPARILELGTATGYSTIFLAAACAEFGGRVQSVERDAGLAREAETNFKRAGLNSSIDVLVGEAVEVMESCDGPFDFVFLDIDKENYIHVFSLCERILRRGGLLVADNVGFKDADDFNNAVYSSPAFMTVHLFSFLPFHSPEHDGICLAVRR